MFFQKTIQEIRIWPRQWACWDLFNGKINRRQPEPAFERHCLLQGWASSLRMGRVSQKLT